MPKTGPNANNQYSQNNEEEIILKYFAGKDDGRFLEIGAYNGRDLSNTHQLALNGWRGVCVEPSPKVFVDLANLYKENPKIELINGAVEIGCKFMSFYDTNGDAISTTEDSHLKKWAGSATFNRPFYLLTVPMIYIADKFGRSYNFINIDTEGSNLRLFGEALTLFDCQMYCVEHDGQPGLMTKMAQDLGYTKVLLENAENIIFAR